jgi:tripartite-type tricarboxylate transporter receptor subunit TctC
MSIIEKSKAVGVAGLVLGTFGVLAMTASTASAADFYKGKQITCYSSGSGSYMAYARYVGKYMTKYIPGNPTWVSKEMRGASGLKLANFMAKKAKKDGTEMAVIHGHILTTPLFSSRKIAYKVEELNWLGSATKEVFISYLWNGSTKARSMADLKTMPTKMGGQAVGSFSIDMAILAKKFMGLDKMKILTGYRGSSRARLAMERGEITGVMGTSYTAVKRSKPKWLSEGKVTILAHMAQKPDARMPGVPPMGTLIKDPDQRAAYNLYNARSDTGKPFFTAPGVPKKRVAILRAAFEKVIRDPAFIAEVQKGSLEVIEPMTGAQVQAFVGDVRKIATKKAVKILNNAWGSFADQKM